MSTFALSKTSRRGEAWTGGLVFKSADCSGLEHIFHRNCDEWADVLAKWNAGYRRLDSETGRFYNGEPSEQDLQMSCQGSTMPPAARVFLATSG